MRTDDIEPDQIIIWGALGAWLSFAAVSVFFNFFAWFQCTTHQGGAACRSVGAEATMAANAAGATALALATSTLKRRKD